jgi:uncharacterized repeat protein (TIGR02543 family)
MMERALSQFAHTEPSRQPKKYVSIFAVLALVLGLFLADAGQQPALAAPTYKISFVANGGFGSMTTQTVGSAGAKLKKNSFKRTHYAFAGWATGASANVKYKDLASIKPRGNLKLFAKWIPVNYRIDFYANSGLGQMASQLANISGVTLAENKFTRVGYQFAGWSTSAGSAVSLAERAKIKATKNLMLFAKWSLVEYTMSFNASGPSGSMPNLRFNVTNGVLPANMFTQSGATFMGWAKSVDGPVIGQPGQSYRTAGNVTLWPIFKSGDASPIAPTVAGHRITDLLWAEEFKGSANSSIDTKQWTARYCGHDGANGGGTCHNNEPQWYIPDAIKLDGSATGNAVITTTRTENPPAGASCLAWSGCTYTSGRFDTQGKVSFKYGYIEARIKMPKGGNNWPAFWMIGDNIVDVGWPASGEIDIAEQGGHQPWRNSAAVHYSTNGMPWDVGAHTYDYGSFGSAASSTDYSADFHVYGLAWKPDRLEVVVDGNLFFTLTKAQARTQKWAFNDYFFIILNNATGAFGGDWDGWSSSKTYIDYVRAWKMDGYGEVVKR